VVLPAVSTVDDLLPTAVVDAGFFGRADHNVRILFRQQRLRLICRVYARFSAAMFLGQGASMLLTPKLAKRFDKRKLMIFTNFGQGVSFLLILALYFAFPHSLHLAAPFALLSIAALTIGVFSGVVNVLLPIMIADSLDIYENENGKRPDGMFFSGMTMVNKLSYGVGAVIVGAVFAVVGFSGGGVRAVNESLYNGANFRTDDAFEVYRTAIFVLASVPPAAGSLLSIIPLRS